MEPTTAWIDRALLVADDVGKLHEIRAEIAEFCKVFPAPGDPSLGKAANLVAQRGAANACAQ